MIAKILIIDDEEVTRRSLAEILKLEGYSIETRPNGEQGLEALEEEDFDLLLLDLKMPGMNGLEVLEKVPSIAPDTRVIMLTAHGSLDSAIQAIRQGAHDYILKPAEPEEILASVSKAVGLRSESDRKRQLLEQMESSLRELKDAEGVETEPEVSRNLYTVENNVKIDLERREIWKNDQHVALTPTEGKLMKIMLANRGKVLTHKELVLLVQGYQTTDWEAPEIMRPLVSRLRRKLALFDGGEDWIVNVRGTGYVFDKQ